MNKEPIRILQVFNAMKRGGAESMLMSLYRNIDRKKVQFDFIVHVQDSSPFDSEILTLGGIIYRCPKYNGKNHFEYVKWWNHFFKENKGYKIIHGHLGSTATIYLSIAKKYGLFTIAHSHNSKMSFLYSIFSYPTRYIADYCFACSEMAGKNRFGNRVYSKSYSVLKNAIDTKQFIFNQNIRNEVRKEFGLRDELVIGTVGRMNEQKNPFAVIKIFKNILQKRDNAKFLWVGDGNLRHSIEISINKEGLSDSIILTGSRKDVNRILQAMDIFILPSLFEGLPVCAIEAQAAGLQCFISDSVSTETSITDRCHFLSLNNYECWADMILSTDTTRIDSYEQIIDAGYDIKKTSDFIYNFYTGIVKEKLSCLQRYY